MGTAIVPTTPGPPGPSTTATAAPSPRKARPGYSDLLAQNPADRELIQLVEQRVNYQNREASRWALERQMFENIAFFLGIQWIEYTETTRRFQRWNAPAWFPTPITNAIKPRVGKMNSALLRCEPEGRVRPKSNDPEDRDAAKVAEQLVAHSDDVIDEDTLRQLASMMVCLTGTVIAEDTFNPNGGRLLEIPRMTLQDTPAMEPVASCPACGEQQPAPLVGMPCPVCNTPMEEGTQPRTFGDGSPMLTSEMVPATHPDTTPDGMPHPMAGQPIVDRVPEGELESRVIMLFNFYWDQKAKDLKEARWCGETSYADIDWIDANYPDFGPFVDAEQGIDSANFYEASILALVGPSVQGTAHYGGTQYFTHGAVIRRYQEKPSAKYPQGLQLIVSNGVLLHKGPLPIVDENGNPTGDLSYTEFKYDLVPGRFAGSTPVDDMIPLQKRINGIDAQIILNRKTLLNPWVLAPKGSGLNPGVVAMRPGATVVYNFVGVGTAPQVVQGQPLPAQVYQEREGALQGMNELAEDAMAEANQAPQGMRSGIAFNLANEFLEAMKMPRRKRWALWIRDRVRKRLLLMQRYYREDRAVKLLGDGDNWQVKYWQGADLRGNTDITVDWGSLQPRSPSVKSQMVFDAIDAGLIDIQDPIQRQQALEELTLSGFETQVGPDRKRAQKENAGLDEGQSITINDFDDHQVHLFEHLYRQKDPGFDNLPAEAQIAHRMHTAMHQRALAMAAAAQMQAAAMGAPPAPPGAGDEGGAAAALEAGPTPPQGGPVQQQAA